MMDAQVDTGLGDSIIYSIGGQPVTDESGSTTIHGFLIDQNDDGGFDGIKPMQRRWQLKVAKRYVPQMKLSDRVESPLLDGKYRPATNNPTSAGHYWIADLQKASA